MGQQDSGGMPSRSLRIVRAVAVFGVVLPVVVLGVLYLGVRALGLVFGDVVFALTILTMGAWVIFAGWGRRMDAARPSGELFRSSATDYGSEVSRGRFAHIPLPARLVVLLTGTVALGWIVIMAAL